MFTEGTIDREEQAQFIARAQSEFNPNKESSYTWEIGEWNGISLQGYIYSNDVPMTIAEEDAFTAIIQALKAEEKAGYTTAIAKARANENSRKLRMKILEESFAFGTAITEIEEAKRYGNTAIFVIAFDKTGTRPIGFSSAIIKDQRVSNAYTGEIPDSPHKGELAQRLFVAREEVMFEKGIRDYEEVALPSFFSFYERLGMAVETQDITTVVASKNTETGQTELNSHNMNQVSAHIHLQKTQIDHAFQSLQISR